MELEELERSITNSRCVYCDNLVAGLYYSVSYCMNHYREAQTLWEEHNPGEQILHAGHQEEANALLEIHYEQKDRIK